MYQYDSKGKTIPEKSKTNAPAANNCHVQTGLKVPVQTKSLFSPSLNQENSRKNANLSSSSRPAQIIPMLSYSPLQMQLAPKQENKEPWPLLIKLNEEQERLKPVNLKPNNTGIPLQMKEKLESLSGFSFDDVKVHYNSGKPAKLQALAYTQGNQVHIAPGQEKYLGHELGHVVQQKQGLVRADATLDGLQANTNERLESSADSYAQALVSSSYGSGESTEAPSKPNYSPIVQFMIGDKQIGTKVIYKKDGNIYIIIHKAISGPSIRYRLQHTVTTLHMVSTTQDNDDYDVWESSEPPIGTTPTEALTSIIMSAIEPTTTSEASEEMKILSATNDLREQVIRIEKENPGSHMFYNALGVGAYILHRLLNTIYEIHNQVSLKNFVFLRAFGEAPRPEASEGPTSFLASRKAFAKSAAAAKGQMGSAIWSDHIEKASLLSANISLLANINTGGESSIGPFLSNGLFDLNKGTIVEKTVQALESLRFDKGAISTIVYIVNKLLSTFRGDAKSNPARLKTMGGEPEETEREAVLYQIAIPTQLVDKLVYIATLNGHTLDYKHSFVNPADVMAGIAAAGRSLSKSDMVEFGFQDIAVNPSLVLSGEFTKMTLEAAKSPEFWRKIGANHPQARLLLNQKYFGMPTGMIKMFTHKRLTPETERLTENAMYIIKMNTIGKIMTSISLNPPIIPKLSGLDTDNPDSRETKWFINSIGIIFESCFLLKNKYIGLNLTDMTSFELAVFLELVIRELRGVRAIVKTILLNDLYANNEFYRQCQSGAIRVICQGNSVKFDEDIPYQMTLQD